MITELKPLYSQKSFYGKALVIDEKGVKTLQSYQTKVCRIDEKGNFERLWNGYSVTTMKHIHAFRLACGLQGMNKMTG